MKKPTKTARFVFERWEDTPLKKKYLGSFSNFETEVRNSPECPEVFKWVITLWFDDGPNPEIEEGKILEATYFSDEITVEDIEKFFKDYKIHVRRAYPFFVNRETGLFGFLKFILSALLIFGAFIISRGKKIGRK